MFSAMSFPTEPCTWYKFGESHQMAKVVGAFLSDSPNSFFDECDSRWNHESRQNRCWPIFNSCSAWYSDIRTFRVKPHFPYLIQFPEKKQSDIIFDGSSSPSSNCRQSLEEIRERLEVLDHIWKHLISFIPTNLTRLAFRANFCGFLVSPSKLIWKKKAKLLFDTFTKFVKSWGICCSSSSVKVFL